MLRMLGRREQQHPVGTGSKVAVAQPADAHCGQLERELVPLDDQVVVAQCLPLLESHTVPESRISCATSSGSPPVPSIACTPASLRTHVSWRLAYLPVWPFI